MADALFHRDGDLFVPPELARSPWTDQALHGGPPAALIARAMEGMDGEAWWVVRLTIDIMGEIPVVPLRLETGLDRGGRRVQLIEAKVSDPGGATLMRAFAWRGRPPGPLPLHPPVGT